MTESKLIKATHQGELDLNGYKLSCAVLENGERVFSERSLALAFGIKGSGAYWQKKRESPSGAFLPEYLSTKYIKPFIDKDLEIKLSGAKEYIAVSGTKATGIDATLCKRHSRKPLSS